MNYRVHWHRFQVCDNALPRNKSIEILNQTFLSKTRSSIVAMANFSNYFDMDKVNSMISKVKNSVMQYSEYEAKAREATNNDKWGTAATDMMDIANATHNFQHFNDIMSTIYSRLHEPPSSSWRQTYKVL